MTDNFKAHIKASTEPLFYNSTGSTDAYKLGIRHLSAAMSAGVAKLSMVPNDVLHIVNLENESIEVVSTKIKLVELEVLK